MKLAVVFLLGLLVGCTAPAQTYNMQRTEATVHIRVVDKIPGRPNLYGLSECNGGECTVYVRRAVYPKCLLHEIRHAFEGDFHKGLSSTEDCL